MSAKKWLLMFAGTLCLLLVLCVGFNILMDPFGVFGDPLTHWDSYNMTNNPRVGKLEYLEEHHEAYNAYIIGSSSAASLDPALLEQYTGDQFYNLFVYGCDTKVFAQLADYVAQHYTVDHLVLNLGMNEAATYDSTTQKLTERNHALATGEGLPGFYLDYALCNPKYSGEKLLSLCRDTLLPQSFDVFHEESGCYDKRVRDVEKIGDLTQYLAQHGNDFPETEPQNDLLYIEQCAQSVEQIAALCEEKGIELTVIFSPVYISQWNALEESRILEYKARIAEITDFWDFSYSSVSCDSRYFYDSLHFRNATGRMMLARIFRDPRVYCPEDFGVYVSKDTEPGQLQREEVGAYSINVPVLMYHHLDAQAQGSTTMTPETFRRQMLAIREAGYETVTVAQLYDYVYHGTELPERPVCITFDDGYTSNYTLALPILEELGMKGTVFAIGSSVGHDRYKDTDYEILPHFDYEQIREMQAGQTLDVQSHSYDLHQWEPYETGKRARSHMGQLPLEGEEDYCAVLQRDLETYALEFRRETGREFLALAYPMGVYSTLSEVLIHESGIPITFSTDTDCRNTLVKGLPQTLYALCRLNVAEDTTVESLLDYLQQESGPKE